MAIVGSATRWRRPESVDVLPVAGFSLWLRDFLRQRLLRDARGVHYLQFNYPHRIMDFCVSLLMRQCCASTSALRLNHAMSFFSPSKYVVA